MYFVVRSCHPVLFLCHHPSSRYCSHIPTLFGREEGLKVGRSAVSFVRRKSRELACCPTSVSHVDELLYIESFGTWGILLLCVQKCRECRKSQHKQVLRGIRGVLLGRRELWNNLPRRLKALGCFLHHVLLSFSQSLTQKFA